MKKTVLSIFLGGLLCSSLSVMAQSPKENVPVKGGSYEPSWESLAQWECPEWFKDAKFGIWAHWWPQCLAEDGDWYARFMYFSGTGQYNYHVANYGNPATYGLKEMCRDWKAEQWDPEALVKLYHEAGARYFFTLGQHHDNFDLWQSPYQEWNSVNMGPKKDIVKGWSDACKKYGLPVGVSMHGSHAWTWLEGSQSFDGNLKKEDGVGKWWEGYDPQELYAQNHPHSTGWDNTGTIHSQWAWGNGAALPTAEYKQKFQNRVLQCINDYQPDMLYFDDTVLPFHGCDETIGLNILSHYYNTNPSVVVMGKILEAQHKKAMLWDVERGVPDRIQADYWQTCTCLGQWHYDKNVYNNNGYKSAQQVIDMLVDIVSKNGNLLLSVPVKGNGSIDDKEKNIISGIKAWMDQNSRSIYGTRIWKTFGEGPLADSSNPLSEQGFNEGINYSAQDVRYVVKYAKTSADKDTLFATIMRWPAKREFKFELLGRASQYFPGEVETIELLGHGAVESSLGVEGLTVTLPETNCNSIAPVFAITFKAGTDTPMSLAETLAYYEQSLTTMDYGFNTGHIGRNAVEDFKISMQEAKAAIGSGEEKEFASLDVLRKAWKTLKSDGMVQPGAPSTSEANTDITVEQLIEKSDFTRTAATKGTTRFGAPEYWTVENFNIPLGGNDGTKAGLDAYKATDAYSYSGKNCLMLGLWNDRDKATAGCDLANARIYRKVHLTEGRYYFGSIFNQSYNLSEDAYMFASSEISKTNEIPEKAIAFGRLNKAPKDGATYWGITFVLDKEQDIYLGFAADLTGNNTQEFRACDLKLLRYEVKEPAIQSDQTLRLLHESKNFARADETVTTRFAAPKYWTVENFNIPNGGDGTKHGLDKYPGYDCLMLGLWNDRGNNTEGDLTNARIYQKVRLTPGIWNFEAIFQTKYSISNSAYIFASPELVSTDQLPSVAYATYSIANAGENDGVWHGVEFRINEGKDMYLGFQANLNTGSGTQEFRVKEVRLTKTALPDEPEAIHNANINVVNDGKIYDLQGRPVAKPTQKGIYIYNGKKVVR